MTCSDEAHDLINDLLMEISKVHRSGTRSAQAAHARQALTDYIARLEAERRGAVVVTNAADRVLEWWEQTNTVGEDTFINELEGRIQALAVRLRQAKEAKPNED